MGSARFRYNRLDQQREGGGGADEDESRGELELEVPCFLDIYVHHARNIHNICIYGNQDVYAKLALTSAPDHAPALCTGVAAGGGASPSFEERLAPLRVRRGRLLVDVLKCEVWMRSCAKALLEDQLLGFALVPLADVAAAHGARLSRDFQLSSTDLFHSPAGTIRLSLGLHSGLPAGDACPPAPEPSIASEVVILESPGLNVVKQNHDDMAVHQYLPFLPLGDTEDLEMSTSPRGDGEEKPASSSDGSKNASTTTTAASDDRVTSCYASARAMMEKPLLPDVHESTEEPMSTCSPETPTSSNGKQADNRENKGDVFTSPLEGIGVVDAEQSEMQRQIMEMYVKSMQQFSESLAKMKVPIELAAAGDGIVVRKEEKNDGARVFYGCRAFF